MAKRKSSLLRAFGPLSVLTVLACSLFVGSLMLGARHIDEAERHREEALVRDDVGRRLVEIQTLLNAYVIWDEAFEHLGKGFDRAWADKNIARSIIGNLRFGEVATLDASDRVTFAAVGQGQATPTRAERLRALAAPLTARIRAIAADPVRRAKLHAIHATAFTQLDGGPVVITASLVRHEFSPDEPGAPILLTTMAVERALVQPMRARFHLDGVRALVAAEGAEHEGDVVLAQVPGGKAIRLAWRPLQPGAQLLSRSTPFLVLASLTLLAAGMALVAHARGVAKSLMRSKERATHLAYHDPLTGLANRALLAERLDQVRLGARAGDLGYAVLCLDLDRFKEVNDTYGHEAGDELIIEVADRLQAVCRAGDTIARLGGDEFAIIQSPATAADAAAFAGRIVQRISGPVELPSGRAQLSCSVGVTVLSDPRTGQMEALRQADLALYRAKAQGRGRYCFFEPEMDAALKAKKSLEEDLRFAVERKELEVAYQPIVRADGRIVAVEALARWTHATRGPVSPATFIPLAEECGLISAIGGLVFRQACRDLASWPGMRLSINVSPVQMRRPDFADRVVAIVAETGVDPRRIDVEITEGVLLQDENRTQDILDGMRAQGFQFALDDFGTGYSSLSYLHRYPVQKIKLDRAFVVGLGDGARAKSIVRALVQLARALDLKVIAEGVETEEQLKQLIACGCDLFQGFLFSRPVPALAFTALLAAGGQATALRPAAPRAPSRRTAA